MIDFERMAKLREQSAPGPWCWVNDGDKCGYAWTALCAWGPDGEPLSGMIERAVYDDARRDYVELIGRHFNLLEADDDWSHYARDMEIPEFITQAANITPDQWRALGRVVQAAKAVSETFSADLGKVYDARQRELLAALAELEA